MATPQTNRPPSLSKPDELHRQSGRPLHGRPPPGVGRDGGAVHRQAGGDGRLREAGRPQAAAAALRGEPARRVDVPRRGAAGRQAEPPVASSTSTTSPRTAASSTSPWSTSTARRSPTSSSAGSRSSNYLPLEHAVHIVRQTAAGLAYAHERRERRRARAAHRPPRRLADEHPRQLRGADEDRRLRHRARAGRAARGVGHRARARRRTCRPSRCAASRPTTARTSSRWASSSTS